MVEYALIAFPKAQRQSIHTTKQKDSAAYLKQVRSFVHNIVPLHLDMYSYFRVATLAILKDLY